jgi:hypothetical protein
VISRIRGISLQGQGLSLAVVGFLGGGRGMESGWMLGGFFWFFFWWRGERVKKEVVRR